MKTSREDLISFINWLDKHMRSQIGIKPSLKNISIFKKNNWLYTGYVYRGIHWGSYYKPYTSSKGKFKIGDRFTTPKDFSSWSRVMKIAASFAAVGAYDDFILSDNPYFTLKQRICKRVKYYGGAGIIVRTSIIKGLDITKAITAIEKTELEGYLSGKIPMMHEAEVLILKPITGEILKHYHPDLCGKVK